MSRLNQFRQKITVEPCIFMYQIARCLNMPAHTYFFYSRSCLDRYQDGDICMNLKNTSYRSEEIMVQSDMARLEFKASLCSQIPPLFLVVLYGILCDRFSRRQVMALPICGFILETALYIAMALRPEMPTQLYMVGNGIVGFTGSWLTFFMAVTSYIAHITNANERTSRLAVAIGAWAMAMIFSYSLGGLIIDATGFVFTFSLAIGCYGCALALLVLMVPDVSKFDCSIKDSTYENEKQEISNKNKTENDNDEKKKIFKSSISKKDICDLLRLLGQKPIILCLCIMFCIIFGEVPFWEQIYLLTKKQPLSWSQTLYGYYRATFTACTFVGLTIVLPILKRFKVKDTFLLMASSLSYITAAFMLGWAKRTWIVFLSGFVAFFSENAFTCTRAILSYYVKPSKLGQAFAVLAFIQGTGEMVGNVTFNLIYDEFLKRNWAGFVFVLAAIARLVPLGVSIFLHIDMKKTGMFEKMKQEELARNLNLKKDLNITHRNNSKDEVDIHLMNNDL